MWKDLAKQGLVVLDEYQGQKTFRTCPSENLDAVFEKFFWAKFEQQKVGSSTPPYLKRGVAQRVYEEVHIQGHEPYHVCELTGILDRMLWSWTVAGNMAPVTNFEVFLMRYRDLDLFNYIDIRNDITLLNANQAGKDKVE